MNKQKGISEKQSQDLLAQLEAGIQMTMQRPWDNIPVKYTD